MPMQKRAATSKQNFCRLALLVAIGLIGADCGSPSHANIELRKQQQTLQSQNDELTTQHKLDVESLQACEQRHPTTRALSPELLNNVVATHGLKFGELTGGDNPDSTQTVDNQLKVYIVPLDADNVPIKAAGAFTVEAYDLEDPAKPLIGIWTFTPDKVRKLFYHQWLLYTYVLNCPWQSPPAHANLTVRVVFDDILTGGHFVAQVQTHVRIADNKQ